MAPASSSTSSYPLYNTTLVLHRVSPLHTVTNVPLNNVQLALHARHFRDVLVGDVLRGVRVGLGNADDPLARVGTLQTVTWEVLKSEEGWLARGQQDDGAEDALFVHDDGDDGGKGMIVEVRYEKAKYTAIMLRAGPGEREGQEEHAGFQRYPLLLTRMPVSLRDSFVQFISTTFDVRVSSLRLPGSYLTTVFERYIRDTGTDEEEQLTAEHAINARTLRRVIKDVQYTLTFHGSAETAALKSVDIMIDREDVPRMAARGMHLGAQDSPFSEALRLYVKENLALDMRHEDVQVSKIACGAFVLGEGRLKLIPPPATEDGVQGQRTASKNLVNGLIEQAIGGQILKPRGTLLT